MIFKSTWYEINVKSNLNLSFYEQKNNEKVKL